MPVEVGQGVHLRATKNIVDDTATARIPGEEYVALWPRCGVWWVARWMWWVAIRP